MDLKTSYVTKSHKPETDAINVRNIFSGKYKESSKPLFILFMQFRIHQNFY